MNILYGVFACVVAISVIINLLLKRPDRGKYAESTNVAWVYIGIPYFAMFIFMAVVNNVNDYAIGLFQVFLTLGYIWCFRILDYKNKWMPVYVPVGIGTFVAGWTLMGLIQDSSRFATLMPSVMVLAGTSFMMAIYFLLRNEDEVLLRSSLGILFMMNTLIKLLYIVSADAQNAIYYIGLFVLDFLIYMLISIIIYFNNFYQIHSMVSKEARLLKEAMDDTPVAIGVLSAGGEMMTGNQLFAQKMGGIRRHLGSVVKALEMMEVPMNLAYEGLSWSQIVDRLSRNEDVSFSTKHIEPSGPYVTYYVVHQIFDHRKQHKGSVVHIYEQKSDEVNRLESTYYYEDKSTGLPSKFEMGQLFDKGAKGFDHQKAALILVKFVTNETHKNKMALMMDQHITATATAIKTFNEVEGIGRVAFDTLEILLYFPEEALLEKLVHQIVNQLMDQKAKNLQDMDIRCMLGIATYPLDGHQHGELFKYAQIALSRAVNNPKERIQFYGDVHKRMIGDRKIIEQQLRSALAQNQFYLMYQPQYHTFTGELRGFEVLLRWMNKGYDRISPNLFIPIAEDMGVIGEIGAWVLEQAIMKGKTWQEVYDKNFKMAINISVVQLMDDQFLPNLVELLDRYEYPPEYLELELAESRNYQDAYRLFTKIKEIKKLGITVALDDFGTGYSSLEYLRWLPFDVLKIDQIFVEHMGSDSIERHIVESVLELMKRLDIVTIAEGVEEAEQLKILQGAGCMYAQGYLYSRPMEEKEVCNLLEESEVSVIK